MDSCHSSARRTVVNNAIGQSSASEVVYLYDNYGLASRKNKLPSGGVMVTLLVPLLVLIVPP